MSFRAARQSTSSKKSLVGYALAYTAGAAGQKALGFLLFVLLAHLLPTAEYAVFGVLFAVQSGIATFAMAGIVEKSISDFKSVGDGSQMIDAFRHANFNWMILAVSTSVVGVLVFITTSHLDPSAILVAVIFGSISAFVTLQSQFFRLQEDHWRAIILSNIPQFVSILFGFIAVYEKQKAHYVISWMLFGLFFSFTLIYLFNRSFRIGIKTPENYKTTAIVLYPFIFIAIFDWIAGYGSLVFVEYKYTQYEVAKFTFAYTLSSIISLMTTALNQVWAPRIYHSLANYDNPLEKESKLFYLYQGFVVGATGSIIIFIVLMISMSSHQGFLPFKISPWEFFFLALGYAAYIPWYYAQGMFYFHGRGRALLKVSVVSGLLGIGVWFLLATRLGTLGPYAGFFALMFCKSMVGVIAARYLFGTRIFWEGVLAASGILTLVAWVASSYEL
jgi:O-antigen/teichoic acid export membrane protein